MSLNLEGITPEIIKEWKMCSPRAWQKVWIDSQLYDSFRAKGTRLAFAWYKRHYWWNPKLSLDAVEIESCALGALDDVQLELKNNEDEFKNIEHLMGRFDWQYKKRITDYIKEFMLPEGKFLTEKKDDDEQSDDPKPVANTKTQPVHFSDLTDGNLPAPEDNEGEDISDLLETETRGFALRLLGEFEMTLARGGPEMGHFNNLKIAFLSKKQEFQELIDLIVFLSRSKQEHNTDITLKLMQSCCHNNNTYHTHNKRLRKAWSQFVKSDTARDILAKIEGFYGQKYSS